MSIRLDLGLHNFVNYLGSQEVLKSKNLNRLKLILANDVWIVIVELFKSSYYRRKVFSAKP